MLFVRWRRRSRRTPKRDRSGRSEQLDPGSRADVLRRSGRTCFSSASDDEVGGLQSAIRSERSEQLDPGSRADVLRRSGRTCFSSASDDEVGGLQSAIRSERSEQLDMVGLAGCDRTGPPAALQCGEGHGGCVLLGFLLVPTSTRSIALIVDLDHGLERLGVVRS